MLLSGNQCLSYLRIYGYFILSLEISLAHGGKIVKRMVGTGIKFIRKLKFVKSNLKGWNRNTFGDLTKRKSGIISDIKDFIL